jgi:hypothetical protein
VIQGLSICDSWRAFNGRAQHEGRKAQKKGNSEALASLILINKINPLLSRDFVLRTVGNTARVSNWFAGPAGSTCD